MKNKYIYWYWENPLKTYNKVKHIFKPLKRKYYFYYGGMRNCAKILDISSFDVCWKDKWSEPRHEYNPRICISLFRRFHFRLEFTVPDDESSATESYWEAILNWIYYKRTLVEAIDRATGWQKYDKETDTYIDVTYNYFKEPYQTYYETDSLPNTLFINK